MRSATRVKAFVARVMPVYFGRAREEAAVQPDAAAEALPRPSPADAVG